MSYVISRQKSYTLFYHDIEVEAVLQDLTGHYSKVQIKLPMPVSMSMPAISESERALYSLMFAFVTPTQTLIKNQSLSRFTANIRTTRSARMPEGP